MSVEYVTVLVAELAQGVLDGTRGLPEAHGPGVELLDP